MKKNGSEVMSDIFEEEALECHRKLAIKEDDFAKRVSINLISKYGRRMAAQELFKAVDAHPCYDSEPPHPDRGVCDLCWDLAARAEQLRGMK